MDGALTPMRIRTLCFGLNVHLMRIAALVLVSRSQTAFPPIESDLATRDYTSANSLYPCHALPLFQHVLHV